MFRAVPPGLIENGAQVLKSLHPWQQFSFYLLFFGSFFLFILAGFFPLKWEKVERKCGAIAIGLFFLANLAFISFPYANSCGWIRGALIFLTTPVCFAICIISMFYILLFCLTLPKHSMKEWVGFGGAISCVLGIAAFLAFILDCP